MIAAEPPPSVELGRRRLKVAGGRLAIALAARYGLARLELDHFPVDGDAARLVDVGSALRHEALPVAHLDGGRLLVAIADPAGGPAASAVAAATDREVVAAVAPRGRLRALIEAAASRAPVARAAQPAAVVEADPPPIAPSPEHGPAPDHHDERIAGLERELEEAWTRLGDAEQRRGRRAPGRRRRRARGRGDAAHPRARDRPAGRARDARRRARRGRPRALIALGPIAAALWANTLYVGSLGFAYTV